MGEPPLPQARLTAPSPSAWFPGPKGAVRPGRPSGTASVRVTGHWDAGRFVRDTESRGEHRQGRLTAWEAAERLLGWVTPGLRHEG